MMKVLDYGKVNGAQDRDDTILVAKIVPHHSNVSKTSESPVNQPNGNGFGVNDIIISQISKSPDALGLEEGPRVRGTVMV